MGRRGPNKNATDAGTPDRRGQLACGGRIELHNRPGAVEDEKSLPKEVQHGTPTPTSFEMPAMARKWTVLSRERTLEHFE
jgi:hypothetical protein